MPGSSQVERRIRAFSAIEDIVSAMKAYAGVTIRRTEEMVRSVRDYEEQVLRTLAAAAALDPEFFAAAERGARRAVVAFGSSQGLCGALNDHVADLLLGALRPGDRPLIIGRRLRAAAAARGMDLPEARDSIVSVSGIRPAIEQTIGWITERYHGGEVDAVEFVFTQVAGHQASVVRERILPPDATALAARRRGGPPPLLTLEVTELTAGAVRELIVISLYRAFAESLRSENWHRMRVLEGATESLKRRMDELGSLRNQLRQEEITEEMLEILSSGGFFAR